MIFMPADIYIIAKIIGKDLFSIMTAENGKKYSRTQQE
jgi:hypothetical protein